MTAPRGSGGTGASEAEVEAVATHLGFRAYERACRDMRHPVKLTPEEAWSGLGSYQIRHRTEARLILDVAAAVRPAPAGEASEVERLRAALAASEDERGRMAEVAVNGWLEHNHLRWDAEDRARDALAMILFVGLCGGDAKADWMAHVAEVNAYALRLQDKLTAAEADNARLRATLAASDATQRPGAAGQRLVSLAAPLAAATNENQDQAQPSATNPTPTAERDSHDGP